ncbi:MAG: hypothetical protein LDLANPLL_00690 [Turneriella sp.]|nr:hypothetical protein [Turneriella sp.]
MNILTALRKAELYLAAISVSLLLLTSLTIILVRMFSSTAWAVGLVDLLSQYPSHFMVVSAFLGGSIAISRGETLKIEVLNNVLGEKAKKIVQRLVAFLGIVFFGAFIAIAIRYLTVDYRPMVAFLYLPLLILIWLKILLELFVIQHKPIYEA